MPDMNTSNSITLPYSLEAEQAVLGAVLTDPECMEDVTNRVKQEYFYLPQHRVIFGSMLSMYTGSKAKIDPVVIADVLAKEGQYDVAGGREYLIDVYYDLCKALGKEVEPVFGPPRLGDIRDSNADISKARELLGYDPEYDFAKGIQLAIDWYKENL